MTGDICPEHRQSAKGRSRTSNGSTLHLFGDGRSVGARRFRDLVRAFGDEAGGFDQLSASGQQLVRRIAQVSVELEAMEAERAAGGEIDPVVFVKLVNVQRRALRDLERIKGSIAAKRSPLREHLERHYGGAEAA